MLQDHRLQLQRFELKYLVEEPVAVLMRDFISGYLDLDDYGAGRANMAYPVQSVYLDSEDLRTHQATVTGIKNRYKLRMRYYDDKPGSPVFFEVKARVNNCILKRRCGVRRDAIASVLNGQWPAPEQFITGEPRHFAALERFILLMSGINARPRAHNSYLREAWVSPNDNSLRVTFDRNVRIEPHFDLSAPAVLRDPICVYAPLVILEVKFTDRFPNWLRELVQRFNLMQSAAAKYSGGVLCFGEKRFNGPLSAEEELLAPFVSTRGVADLILAEL